MSSMSWSASKWLCWLKMNWTIVRCWPVKRCGRGRLDRYSRNLSSGLCETATAGRCTLLLLVVSGSRHDHELDCTKSRIILDSAFQNGEESGPNRRLRLSDS